MEAFYAMCCMNERRKLGICLEQVEKGSLTCSSCLEQVEKGSSSSSSS